MTPGNLTRRAGALYTAALFTAGFSYFARDGLVDIEDIEATMRSIEASETLFRLAILGDIVLMALYFFLAMTLYQAFREVRKTPAMLMAGLVLVGLPVMLVNIFSHVLILEMVHGQSHVGAFSPEQLNGLAYLFLSPAEGGGFLLTALIGPWLLPLGYLVYISGRFPKLLGIAIVAAGIIYLAALCASVLSDRYLEIFTPLVFTVPGIIEIVTALWLLFGGKRR
jgi:hypothetical protein